MRSDKLLEQKNRVCVSLEQKIHVKEPETKVVREQNLALKSSLRSLCMRKSWLDVPVISQNLFQIFKVARFSEQ